MKGKKNYRILGTLSFAVGFVLLVMAWLNGMVATIYMPIGFSFGIAELSWYDTWQKGLTNLFWHMAPGLAGIGITLVILAASLLLLWGGRWAWRRALVT